MFVPSQGFRHAATLLLTNTVRAIPADASPEATRMLLERLAGELVALANDTRAPAGVGDWLIAEYNSTIDRMHQLFDRERAKSAAATILAGVGSRTPVTPGCDLFLIYVPEDRLPIAAPLAVELTKRRVSVAFAEYEVATDREFATAVAHGLDIHRGGAVLWTVAFNRRGWPVPREHGRVRMLHDPQLAASAADLSEWVTRLRRVAK